MRSHNDDNQLVKVHMEEEGVEDDFILSLSKSHEKNLLDLSQNKGQNFLALTVVQADSHSDGHLEML